LLIPVNEVSFLSWAAGEVGYLNPFKAVRYREMIYTGPIDEFFDYRFGKLPY
jgi:UDP-galactopyranose mutase